MSDELDLGFALLSAAADGGAMSVTLKEQSAKYFIKKAIQHWESQEKVPDIRKSGMEIALELASKAGGKPDFLKGLWDSLVRYCLNPDAKDGLTFDDLALLETITTQAELALILYIGSKQGANIKIELDSIVDEIAEIFNISTTQIPFTSTDLTWAATSRDQRGAKELSCPKVPLLALDSVWSTRGHASSASVILPIQSSGKVTCTAFDFTANYPVRNFAKKIYAAKDLVREEYKSWGIQRDG